MAFESCVVHEDWRSAVIDPLHKGKGEVTEYKNFRVIAYKRGRKNICGNISGQSP